MNNGIEPVTLRPTRPVQRPVMLQGWYNLTSLHWRYSPGAVQRLLPNGLTVDTYDGSAWVGLIPFDMRRIRLPFGPSAGPWSTFPETNVRAYIIDPEGRRGVWFCSLDITRLAPTIVARTTYGLPYCWADMSITVGSSEGRRVETAGGIAGDDEGRSVHYRSKRRWLNSHGERTLKTSTAATSYVDIRIGNRLDVSADSVEAFLSARWALGSTFLGKLLWAEVDHPEWVLHAAEVQRCDETLLWAAGLAAPDGDPLALWSPGVEVRIARPRLVKSPVQSI
jgi:uncharacterized protein